VCVHFLVYVKKWEIVKRIWMFPTAVSSLIETLVKFGAMKERLWFLFTFSWVR